MRHQSIINSDYKTLRPARSTGTSLLNPAYLLSALAAVLIAVTLLSIDPDPAQATRQTALQIPPQSSVLQDAITASSAQTDPEDLSDQSMNLAIPESSPVAIETPANDPLAWQDVTVKQGDNLALIFDHLGLSPQELHNLLNQGGAVKNLEKIYPGQTFRVATNDGTLAGLSYPIDHLNTLEVRQNADGYDISTVTRTPEFRTHSASGKIESSLFLAASKAGLNDSMTMELAGIFGWDIDFALDIREGDQFNVLYEEMYVDGENIGNGTILAAEFVNDGKRYQAVRYTDAGGNTDYYSLDGKSMRKAFLRTPVEFSRISSGFSMGRKHPVLNKIRAHKGVDYAASTGTPIKATGNGKVIFRGKKGGYGNVIILQHGSKYSTLYAHMSKFRSGLSVGSRVKQGQTIGYVGMSGLATGPHLHYEFRIDGAHRDPLRVKLPGADPLNKKYMADFNSKAKALLAQLDLMRDTRVASASTE